MKIYSFYSFSFILNVILLLPIVNAFEAKISTHKTLKNISIDSNRRFYKTFLKNHILNSLYFNGFNQSVLRDESNSYSNCAEAIYALLSGDINVNTLHFLDSWGKIPAGLFYGNFVSLGNFDECVAAKTTTTSKTWEKEIRGKYFLVEAAISGRFSSIIRYENRPIYVRPRMVPFFLEGQSAVLPLTFGTCFPSECSGENVRDLFQTAVDTTTKLFAAINGGNAADNESDGENGTTTDSTVPIHFSIRSSSGADEERSFDAVALLAVCTFSVIGILMLLSSFYDVSMRSASVPPNSLLMSFSVFANGRKLFRIHANSSDDSVECLNGIRVLSTLWVVFGHTHIWLSFFPFINVIDIADWIKASYSMVVQAGTVSVDSFLLLSGVLIAWVTLAKMEQRDGGLNIPLAYFHRYIRLAPVLAAEILFVNGILPHLGEGPFFQDFTDAITANCRTNWWATLLFINNYVQPYELCLRHTWYLAVDTQLFVVSPFLMMGLWRWKSKFLRVLLLLCVLSYGCVISTMMIRNLTGLLIAGLASTDQNVWIYYPTHLRMAPWLIGLALGYWLRQMRHRRPLLSGGQLLLGWLVALSLMATVLFAPYHFAQEAVTPTVLEAALYEAFARTAWVLGVAWIIFVCHTGHSSTVNDFLSYSGWQPLARLTYAMYLISVVVQNLNAATIKTEQYFSAYDVIRNFWAELGVGISVAIVVVLALESPVIAVEKYFLNSKTPQS